MDAYAYLKSERNAARLASVHLQPLILSGKLVAPGEVPFQIYYKFSRAQRWPFLDADTESKTEINPR